MVYLLQPHLWYVTFYPNIVILFLHSLKVTQPEIGFPKGYYITSTEEYDALLLSLGAQLDPATRHSFGHFAAIACELILYGIETSGSFDSSSVAHAIRTATYPSFTGEISFKSDGSNMNPGISLQRNYTSYNIIGPSEVVNASVIYPIPTWNERLPNEGLLVVEIIAIILLCLAVVNSLGWCIYIIIHRDKKQIVASSPLFLTSMLIGMRVLNDIPF